MGSDDEAVLESGWTESPSDTNVGSEGKMYEEGSRSESDAVLLSDEADGMARAEGNEEELSNGEDW